MVSPHVPLFWAGLAVGVWCFGSSCWCHCENSTLLMILQGLELLQKASPDTGFKSSDEGRGVRRRGKALVWLMRAFSIILCQAADGQPGSEKSSVRHKYIPAHYSTSPEPPKAHTLGTQAQSSPGLSTMSRAHFLLMKRGNS